MLYLPVAVALFMHRIAQGDPSVNRSPVQLNRSAQQADLSAELLAANSRLLAQRASAPRPSNGWMNALRHGITQPLANRPKPTVEPTLQTATTIKLNPTLALAMLQAQAESAGRVWLLCRALDVHGRGWLSIEELRNQLTSKQSKWRICGWRRLRQILQQGEGLFWQRQSADRLWLKSAKRVALGLKVDKLHGTPIALPIATLTKSIRSVRAHFYTSFHSNRSATPISRQTLATVTGVAERTQRDYDRLANTVVTSNIAIGARFSAENRQTESFARPAVFPFTDKLGKQGAINQRYIAWRLPNSYQSAHDQTIHGRQRKINRWLNSHTDLVKNRAQGNSGQTTYQQVFFDPMKKKITKPHFGRELFWRDPQTKLWHHQEQKN